MAELAMLADVERTVYPDEVTRQLHVMVQARESSPVIDRRSNQLYYASTRRIHVYCTYFTLLEWPQCRFEPSGIPSEIHKHEQQEVNTSDNSRTLHAN